MVQKRLTTDLREGKSLIPDIDSGLSVPVKPYTSQSHCLALNRVVYCSWWGYSTQQVYLYWGMSVQAGTVSGLWHGLIFIMVISSYYGVVTEKDRLDGSLKLESRNDMMKWVDSDSDTMEHWQGVSAVQQCRYKEAKMLCYSIISNNNTIIKLILIIIILQYHQQSSNAYNNDDMV